MRYAYQAYTLLQSIGFEGVVGRIRRSRRIRMNKAYVVYNMKMTPFTAPFKLMTNATLPDALRLSGLHVHAIYWI